MSEPRTVSCTWIEQPAEVTELGTLMAEHDEHGIDTESNSGFAYFERLCLLQVAVADRLFVVDLIALGDEGGSLEPLRPALESATIRTCLHGGEFDAACLRRDFGIELDGVWDTQQAASLLGWPKTGYGTVVEELCGVTLAKQFSLHDWSRRPVDPRALEYAINDVRYLPDVCRRLSAEVERKGIEEEVELASRAVAETQWNGGFQLANFWRVKGVRALPADVQAVLFALYTWRDERARVEDRPPGRLLHDQILLALARRPPQDASGLRRRGVRRHAADRYGGELLEVLADAKRQPPTPPPAPEPRRTSFDERRRSERLRNWRRQEAERRRVTEQVVLPTKALNELSRRGAERLEEIAQLGDKRIRLYGDELRRLC